MARIIKALSLITLLSFTHFLNAALPVYAAPRPKPTATSVALQVTIVPTKPIFKLDERLEYLVTLKNVSQSEITVCTTPHGVFHVSSFKRNGRSIRSETILETEIELILSEWVEGLRTLQPGEEVQIPVLEEKDRSRGIGGPVVFDFTANRKTVGSLATLETTSVAYAGGGAGRYELAISYQYTGPHADKPNVYTGKIISNTATFVYE